MKKTMLCIAMLAVLMCSLLLPAYASQGSIQIENVTSRPVDRIYVPVNLSDVPLSDTVGVYVTYDETLLKLDTGACSWARDGVLQDFSADKNAGVWTDTQAQDLNGLLCTMAFSVVAEQKVFQTTISFKVTVKNRAEVTGEFTMDVQVSCQCDHTWSAWTQLDEYAHVRSCPECGSRDQQGHDWSDGVTREDPEQPGVNIVTYTCRDCQAVQQLQQGQVPETQPEPTQGNPAPSTSADPTAPTTAPAATEPDREDPKENDYTLVAILAGCAVAVVVMFVLLRKKK